MIANSRGMTKTKKLRPYCLFGSSNSDLLFDAMEDERTIHSSTRQPDVEDRLIVVHTITVVLYILSLWWEDA